MRFLSNLEDEGQSVKLVQQLRDELWEAIEWHLRRWLVRRGGSGAE